MITSWQLQTMRDALNSMRGRLSILSRSAEIALERLNDAELQRDEAKAACEALDTAVRHFEEEMKPESAPVATDADSGNSSRIMAVELDEKIPSTAKRRKKK